MIASTYEILTNLLSGCVCNIEVNTGTLIGEQTDDDIWLKLASTNMIVLSFGISVYYLIAWDIWFEGVNLPLWICSNIFWGNGGNEDVIVALNAALKKLELAETTCCGTTKTVWSVVEAAPIWIGITALHLWWPCHVILLLKMIVTQPEVIPSSWYLIAV